MLPLSKGHLSDMDRISDETFYTQSQIMVEKVPRIFGRISLPSTLGMVTSGQNIC